MKGSLAGYTVVEVMIFLTISSVLLVSAVSVFSGRREQTQFTQTMYDLQSQFRSYANQVSTSYLSGLNQYTCDAGNNVVGGTVRPVLTAAAGTSGLPTQDCILLGRAIQIIPGTSTIYSYPVFGLRTIHNGSVDTGASPSSATQSAPEPGLNSSGQFLMVESYDVLNGFTVNSTKLTTNNGSQDLLLLYSSLQNNNTSGSEIDASSQGVGFTPADVRSNTLKGCIEGLACGATNPIINGAWKLCVQSGSKLAQLLIRGTPTGITTSLNMDGCP